MKDRKPLITPEIENTLYDEMTKQVEQCKSKVLAINGCPDHVHMLISLSSDISFSNLVKQIKGATSHWINSTNLIDNKFSWQKGPRGFSVSQSVLGRTINYIANQKEKHKVRDFQEEFQEILKIHGLEE